MTLLDLAGARARLEAAARRMPAEDLPLEAALGRVTARALRADRDLPPFDRAAVDGYAVKLEGPWVEGASFAVVGRVAAGERFHGRLRPGQAVQIMTGAPVPPGADGVVMVERSERTAENRVRLGGPFDGHRPGLAPRGEDARRGAVVVPRGTRIDPGVVAVLASIGCTRVPVVRRAEVSLVITGPEIVPVAAKPGPAQIRNSNGPYLAALLAATGAGTLRDAIPAADTLPSLVRAITRAESADVVVLTGGVSMGEFDLVPAALGARGFEIRVHRVAIRPGKPFLLATKGSGAARKVAMGLPGNPVSVAVTAWEFLIPFLRRMGGLTPAGPQVVRARAVESIERRPGLTQFVLAVLAPDRRDRFSVRPIPWHGSGDLIAASRANAWIVLPAERPAVRAGQTCEVHPLYREPWSEGSPS